MSVVFMCIYAHLPYIGNLAIPKHLPLLFVNYLSVPLLFVNPNNVNTNNSGTEKNSDFIDMKRKM